MTEICPATRIEKILLSTDGSEYSEGAVREAIRLAKRCSSRLTALSVVDTNPEFASLAPQLVEKMEQEARQRLEAVRSRAAEEGVECVISVRDGEDAHQVIVDEAAGSGSDLIVMGRRGRTGLKRLMMGSVTARVIGHASCNVLVVPKAARLEFSNILVATDGSKYSRSAASEAIGLAKRNGSSLTVVSVIPSDIAAPTDVGFSLDQRELVEKEEMHEAEKNAKAVKEAALKEGVSVRAFVLSGKPSESIVETARERNAELIVLGSHGRAGVDRLLMGSVAERVIVLSSCPVLVAKAGAQPR